MRKQFLSLAFGIVLIMLTLTVAISAAPAYYSPNNEGAFSITYADATQGEYYALVVLSGVYNESQTPVVSEDTVQYINQETAGASGVTFDNVIIKDDNTECTVYLGGSDLDDGPVLLGYLNASGFTVSGTITTDSTLPATVKLLNADETVAAQAQTAADGTYSFTVSAGTYKFTVSKSAHLSYTKNEFVVAGDTTKDVTLLGGDLTGDNVINEYDLSYVRINYGSTSEIDVTGDGIINEYELSKVRQNYSKASVNE